MPIQQDFLAYQESIAHELRSTKNRVRNLIGPKHWLTDGEHKEAIVRNILRSRLPETVRIGRGFVCFASGNRSSRVTQIKSTGQLDILITSKDRPTLYKDGELAFVTADAVEAVIEVKTSLSSIERRGGADEVLNRLADQVQLIRQHNPDKRCWAGLFVFDNGSQRDMNHETLLSTLQTVTNRQQDRVIDCISIGEDTFVHFWNNGRQDVGGRIKAPVWHSYTLRRLAPAYFISNIALVVSPDIPNDAYYKAWFPIEGGKETRRRYYASLRGRTVQEF